MRRAALGIIGLLLLGGGLALQVAQIQAGWSNMAIGVLIKTGAVTLLFWLAYHQLLRLFEIVPPWMLGAGLLGLGTAIVFPRSILWVLGLFAVILVLHFAGMFLKPFTAKRTGPAPRRPSGKRPTPRREGR